LLYNTDSTADPTEEQFNDAEAITLEYLNLYLQQVFGFTADFEFESFSGSATGVAFRPERIGFEGSAEFAESSNSVPTQADMDSFIATAFELPGVQIFIDLLATLPADNPFSTTTSVMFSSASRSYGQTSESALPPEAIFVIGVLFFLSIGLVGFFSTRRERSRRHGRSKQLSDEGTNTEEHSAFTSSVGTPSMPGYGKFGDEQIEIQFGHMREDSEEERSLYDPLFQAPFARSREFREDWI
jgi:hypothetical protein